MQTDVDSMGISAAVFRDAMARFTTSISAVTTTDGTSPAGVLATSVCSLSAAPPTILACINKEASVHDTIVRCGVFAVNLLSDRQRHIAERFISESGSARFDPSTWRAGPGGVPMLAESVASLACRLLALHEGYSHSILVGEIVDTILDDALDGSPLLWHRRGFSSALVPKT
ncbi:flavin oxidoreductase [Robbsia andropogonis]|uniref:Flavin oxidoreductase n=1 Tax=Robbsia andropogonis TaxID=28092 RepID=A0A0F5JU83_9BURK|nr:flavin reductase family protein [Robbsia andropogonis]KKB61179.1 flavin oxidoreductase [Robbsia andropogonis]MCP1118671.1 flavin reductase family protein [Robbsia andropogonis]MCP1128138.1 flavin reductase family protein [Robbsia andropogonis]